MTPILNKAILAVFLLISFLLCNQTKAQDSQTINWLTFEQLEDSLNMNPKKVFIDFYTDWCTYCRKMDKVVFTKPEVITLLNEQYYAVRFDAESELEVNFGGQVFINDQIGKSRNPVHEIAQLLALRKGQFIPPTIVVLDKDFNVTARHFEYMSSSRLRKVLK